MATPLTTAVSVSLFLFFFIVGPKNTKDRLRNRKWRKNGIQLAILRGDACRFGGKASDRSSCDCGLFQASRGPHSIANGKLIGVGTITFSKIAYNWCYTCNTCTQHPHPQAIVTPEHEPLEEDISEPGSTLHPTMPVCPTTPTTTCPTTPATTRPPTTPATPSYSKRKRGNNLILEFLQAESVKEQERHKETEAQTERFLTLFEKLVDKMPQQ